MLQTRLQGNMVQNLPEKTLAYYQAIPRALDVGCGSNNMSTKNNKKGYGQN